MKSNDKRTLQSINPKPLNLDDLRDEMAVAQELERRMIELLESYDLEPTADGYREIAWRFALAFLDGFQFTSSFLQTTKRQWRSTERPKSRKARNQRHRRPGNPGLGVDPFNLVCAVDRLVEQNREGPVRMTAHHACTVLTKKEIKYRNINARQLVNLYYRHRRSVQNSANYFLLAPQKYCKLHAENACFTFMDWEESELDPGDLCKSNESCVFYERMCAALEAWIKKLNSQGVFYGRFPEFIDELRRETDLIVRSRKIAIESVLPISNE